jgi:probable HAF family extracellular repeat protein
MLTFNVFELQPPDPRFDTTHAYSVNANGLVGGFINQTTGLAGTTWADPANPQSISAPSSIIYALNDNGDAVGVYGFDNTVTEHAFLFEGGALVDLVPTVPAGSDALGINNSGFVVGNFGLGGHINSPRGYVYNSVTQTAPTIIDPLPGQPFSIARAINKNGAVTGRSGSHGFLFVEGNRRRPPSLVDLGPAIDIADINDSGKVVGSVTNAAGQSQAAYWNTSPLAPSVEIPLPSGGFIASAANAINNSGDVVGNCTTAQPSSNHAFIFTAGASADLNTLIPRNSGWDLQIAHDISDSGQIVGVGLLNGQTRGFLLIPIPPVIGGLQFLEVVGTLLGGVAADGGGIVIVNGVGNPVGPWGPVTGDYAAKGDILTSLALEEMATHIRNKEGQTAIRRAALEAARAQIDALLASLKGREE